MNALDLFREWITSVERRMQRRAIARGAAVVAATALCGTLAGVWLSNRYAFSEPSVLWARLGLFLCIALAVVFALAIPFLRASRRGVAKLAEQHDAGFNQRVLTLVENPDANPFLEIVAEEAMKTAVAWPAERFVPGLALASLGAAAAAFFGVLVWLTAAGPGQWGYGASLLWRGKPPSAEAFYRIEVAPGDQKVRKGAGLAVEARLVGFDAPEVRLMVRGQGTSKWEMAPMEPKTGVPGTYGFLLASVLENIDYRVEAGRLQSSTYRLTVADLPSVTSIRVTYNYPSWLGLASRVEDPGGDLRAVEGTEAVIEVVTDRPLASGKLVLDDGTAIGLSSAGERKSSARIRITREGVYHIAALDEGDMVRISEDYFIEPKPEKPPEVRIARPGRDARVSPIEEVAVEVEASDDYGLSGLELRYSVNAGPEKAVAFPQTRGAKEGKGRTLIALEDYKLQPGDLLSMYAVGRDARNTVQTDIFFLEAQPFEKEYRQGQQAAGGGGGAQGAGEQEGDITKRQKEVIAATWNVIRSKKGAAAMKEDSEFLTGVQKKLGEQARSLAGRMRSRELSGTNEQFKLFTLEMQSAAKSMDAAADRLKSLSWKEALQPEQKALQHLLRAESLFREIQVAFGQSGGGMGGGGGQSRDLESLFDLELDTNKNQYEPGGGQETASNRERQVDEALKKLEELAQRQQRLAEQQQRNRNQQSFQQRWEQEMLRREAEQLRRQMEELSRSGGSQESPQQAQSGQQQQQQGQSQSGQAGQGSSQGQSGRQSQQGGQQAGRQQRSLSEMARGNQGFDPRMNRAVQQLERAIDDMRRSQQSGQGDARRAAERMADAGQALNRMRRQQTGDRMEDLARRAKQLADRQQEIEKRIAGAYPAIQDGKPAPANQQRDRELGDAKDALRQDYEQLERDMQSSARAMAGSQPQASAQVRAALGEAQQDEIKLRLQYGADLVRKGLGAFQAPRERVVTQMMRRLDERMERARQAASEGPGDDSQKREAIETALNQIERARRALSQQGQQSAQQGQGNQGQSGQDGRQGQSGQRGGQGQDRQAGEQGQGGQPGQNAQRGAPSGQPAGGSTQQRGAGGPMSPGYSAMNDGTRQGPWGGGRPGGVERGYAEALRQLESVRSGAASQSEEARAEVEAVIEQMNRLDPRKFPGNPQLLEALRLALLPKLEQLELRLRQQLGESGQSVRGVNPARVPPGYEKAAAEYYRRLGAGKK